ncbi:MAG: HlyD family efflux transporter periplasmic adaptor subunit [Planctomycetaceae bacterium]
MISRSELINTTEPAQSRMLGPSAYSEALLPSLRLARSSRLARRIGRLLLTLLMVGCALVAVAPWQQSVSGSGNVIAFDPTERQQTIEAPIKGRIIQWGPGIFENAHVKAGQLIVEIQDVDPMLMTRLQDQLAASDSQVRNLEQLVQANERNLANAKTIVTTFESQLRAYESVKDQILASADAAIASAVNKIEAEQQQLEETRAALTQAEADYERQKQLFREKIASQNTFQVAERKYLEARAKVAKAEAYVESAKNDLEGKQRDRDAKEQKALVDIEYATASLRKATGDIAKAESDVAKAQSELNKAEGYVLEMQTKVARQQSQVIVAPFDGFLTQISSNQGSQMVKEGDELCVIVPDTADRAVQVWLDGNDAPLVAPGRHVRLQFEGWPAIQFAGWPSVAVGTFGGTVISIDATDDGKGRFRVLVVPEEDDSKSWPSERYLRQGVRTNAWVLLERVPLWFELWRQMNGFPPVVTPDDGDKQKSKPPKLPK